DVLLISTPQDVPRFRALFGDGARLGLNMRYAEQPKPEGLAQAFRIGREFMGRDPAALALGANISYGAGLRPLLKQSDQHTQRAARYAEVDWDGGSPGSTRGRQNRCCRRRPTWRRWSSGKV